MDKVRIVIQSNENGEKEYVEFTDDFDSKSSEFLISGCSIDSDTIINNELPSGFPLNYTLTRD